MKKSLILLFLSLSLISFSPSSLSKPIHKTSIKKSSPIECRYSQCQATARSTGNQCRHCVSNPGDSFCFQHK